MTTYYKGFDKDLKCRGMQFEVGKTYDTGANDEDVELCSDTAIHFCDSLQNVHEHYSQNPDANNRVCEVEPLGKIVYDGSKCGTNKIKIIREIKGNELNHVLGLERGNTGVFNTGHWNTGDWNTGDWNTGYCNTGYCNTGDWNTGDRNTGYCNTGDQNTGDFNKCNHSTGFFNTQERTITIFNKDSGMTYDEFYSSKYYDALNSAPFVLTEWHEFTESEKNDSIIRQSIGGKLISYTYEEACANWWNELSQEAKETIQQIPNFDAKIFKEITGIDVKKKNTRKSR